MTRWLSLWLGLTWAAAPPASGAGAMDAVRVLAIYEPVATPRDVEILRRVHPDLVCRGWFKWHHTAPWASRQPLADQLRDAGIRLQGGITCAAIYPGENGIDEATFRDFTTHDPDGQPVKISFGGAGGWYHLSLYNPQVIAYLKAQVRQQIDAGAMGIWYDEIEGTYDWLPRTGYDRYAVAAFRDWLIAKYVRREGWQLDDERWRTVLGIDLTRHGGRITGFDYRRHLAETPGRDGRPLAADPPQGDPRGWATAPNPLFREWGFAWDRAARGTFRFDTVQRQFDDLVADARTYARQKYGRELIMTYNHNGTARPGVEFLQPHFGAQPICHAGRLNGGASYLAWYEATIADAAAVTPGTPVVFFVDWPSEADRLAALPRADQLCFLQLYIPEAYAAGGEFALPVRGYSYVAEQQGTLATLCRMADFLREHAALFRGSQPVPGPVVAPDGVAARLRRAAAGVTLHLINHRWDSRQVRLEPWPTLAVRLPKLGPLPRGAFAVSTEWPEQRPVKLTETAAGLDVTVPGLHANALVVFPDPQAWRKVAGRGGRHIQAAGLRAQAVADADGRFALWLPTGFQGDLYCLETGERQPSTAHDLRFAAPPSGTLAAGVVLDELGTPLRHTELPLDDATAGRTVRTDAWGRFAMPGDSAGATLRLPRADGTAAAVAVPPGVSEVRLRETLKIVDARQGLLGWWGNWPGRGTPGAAESVQVLVSAGPDGPALEIRFHPVPAAWVNTNSPAFSPDGSDGVELTYTGDGSHRQVLCQIQVFRDNFQPPRPADTFFACPLPLAATRPTTLRLPWDCFVTADGERLTTVHPRRVALQFAPDGRVDRELCLRVHTATLTFSGAAVEVRRPDSRRSLDDLEPERDNKPTK